MKNCEYYEELIGAALDGEITAEEDKELRAHLESCEACRSFYEAMQAISGTDDALGDVPENFTANVMAHVHEAAAPAEKPAKRKAGIARLVTRYGALDAPDGTESVYRLWVEEESLIWQKADGDAAHLSPASPEAWSEILRNASR